MTRFIERPKKFEYDGSTWSERQDTGYKTYDRLGYEDDEYNPYQYKHMPHDAFNALVEAIVDEVMSYEMVSATHAKHSTFGFTKGSPKNHGKCVYEAARSIAARGADSPWRIEVVESGVQS